MTTQSTKQHTDTLQLPGRNHKNGWQSLVLALLVLSASVGYAGAQELTVGDESHSAHILLPPGEAQLLQSAPAGALSYHGGPVMTSATTYAIFWIPSSGLLQDGKTKTSMSAHYQLVQENLLAQYAGHGVDNNNTQYYDVVNGSTRYVNNLAGLGGFYVDTRAYPASGCTDPVTGKNCLSDAEIRLEVQHAMTLAGWTGGLNKVFLLFTVVCLVLAVVPALSQNVVPPTAREAVASPALASRLAKARAARKSQASAPSQKNLASGQDPGVLYGNGPVNGEVDAWTINFGYVVSDSLALASASTVQGFQFFVWAFPGDIPSTVDWSITSQPNGGTIYGSGTANLTTAFLSNNNLGYDIDQETVSFLANVPLDGGT